MEQQNDAIMQFIVNWLKFEHIILNEVSQKEKDRHRIISLIYCI